MSSKHDDVTRKVINQIVSGQKTTHLAQKRDKKLAGKEEARQKKAVAIETASTSSIISEAVFNPSSAAFKGETPAIALDCEMVQVENFQDALARVSIVNYNGHVLLDKFVRPEKRVTDFRTWVSGVHPWNLREENGAISFRKAKEECHRLLRNKIIVGHSLNHDFKVLDFQPSAEAEKKVRDLSRFPKYRNQFGQIRSLKNLTADFLHRKIQQGEHSSVIDAQASMGLYRLNEKDWETHVKAKAFADARKQAEQDVQKMRKATAFFGPQAAVPGQTMEAGGQSKKDRKRKFKKGFSKKEEQTDRKPVKRVIW